MNRIGMWRVYREAGLCLIKTKEAQAAGSRAPAGEETERGESGMGS